MYACTEYYQQEPSPTSVYIKTRGCVFVFLFRVCTAHKQHTRRTTRTLRTFCDKPAAAFVAHSSTATKDLGSQHNARTNLFNTQPTHASNKIEGPFVNSFLMTLNLAQAVPGSASWAPGGGCSWNPCLQIGAFRALHKCKPSA